MYVISQLQMDIHGNFSCHFDVVQISQLLTDQTFGHQNIEVYLTNNVRPSEFGQQRTSQLSHLANFNHISSLKLYFLPTPFLQEHSFLTINQPSHKALFHNKGGIVEVYA